MAKNKAADPAVELAVSALSGDTSKLEQFSKEEMIEAYELLTIMMVIGKDERLPSAMAIVAERILK